MEDQTNNKNKECNCPDENGLWCGRHSSTYKQPEIQNKEWEIKFREENKDTFIEIGLNISQIIDKKMINFIAELLKSQREDLVEKLEEYKLNYNPIGNDINKGRRLACDDILYLIKQSK